MHASPVALITGGSRGIGRGICVELSRRGYSVAINFAGNETAAQETKGMVSHPEQALLCQGDVGQAADRERIVHDVLAAWGRIDVLVNNAGITSIGRKDILQATEDSWDRVLAVNLKGPFFLSQCVAQAMLERLPSLIRPTIINVSSLSAYAMSTNRGDYCISKAGVGTMTQLFALRLANDGIRVFEIRPGIIETDMTSGGHERDTRLIADGLTPIRRWGTPEDVAQAVAALVTGALPYTTGEVIHIDGGYHLRQFV